MPLAKVRKRDSFSTRLNSITIIKYVRRYCTLPIVPIVLYIVPILDIVPIAEYLKFYLMSNEAYRN